MPESKEVASKRLKQDLPYPDYVARFKEGRKAAGFSSLTLGKAIELTPQALLQFESGKQQLKLEKFVAACEAMQLDFNWVLRGEGLMFSYTSKAPRHNFKPELRKAGPGIRQIEVANGYEAPWMWAL
ncbi:MAG: XRE family transcriptional regulator [Hymenobacter sp.]|nr:MAG: XRE family transcriptional regulator [Hymenobacter sp.]